ncbi:MAG: phosphomannomutase/phosphoglucomutase [Bacteroidales bacterium]|jgi:phosphomannomutase|nr:phosphomannomutase/phosphoglucomutase [Bacteroidales bacterium]
MSAFKAYDIRGIYNKDFNKDTVYKIGYFLPELLNTDKILVGRDVRTSSPEIFAALSMGITDAGADVYDVGLSTTPMIYWATAKFGFEASVMITASHNPKEHNGLKISKKDALPVGFDTGLGQLERWTNERLVIPKNKKGKVVDYPISEPYLEFQKTWLQPFDNLNIAMDCSNGMCNLFVKQLYGNRIHYIFDELDGSFPNHEPNPLEPENIVDLQKLVHQTHADIGVIFDGDADRVMFTDENGKFISPDLMIGVLGHYFLEEKGLKGKVLHDIRSSKAVGEYLAPMGGEIEMWRVGRAYAALKLREINGIYGGELAGHYYFRDFYYSDSALMACSLLLHIFSAFKAKGVSVSQVIAKLATYSNSGEINFKIEKKSEAMDAVRDYFKSTETCLKYFDFDGYRLEFADWWFNIRPSNTEPYLRFIAEAKSPKKLSEVVEKTREMIVAFQ